MAWAISGAALCSSVGASLEVSFAAFRGGQSGNAPLRAFDASRYRARRAYEISDRPGGGDVPLRASAWLCESVRQAAAQAGLDGRSDSVPVLVGTGLRELRSLELWWTAKDPLDVGQLHFGGALRRATGLSPALTVSGACSASLFTLAMAADMLALEQADTVVVAGTDAITESMFGLLDRVNMEPPTVVRPFDRERRGVLLGEGAAAVVLERPRRNGGRQPLAWLREVGLSCDAYHATAPDRGGIARAIGDAHRRAGVGPADVDLVMLHGTGTTLNDETEALAIRDVFGAMAGRPLFTALKSMTGHTSGASGLMSLVVAAESMRQGVVPPTVAHRTPIPEVDGFSFVTGEARRADLRIAQVDAFGFGGVNAVAILERPS